jgi:hypothetical protein
VANKKLVALAKKGRAALGRWRKENPDVLLDLSDSDLQNANLRGANLKRADLTGADLRGADLIGTQFAEADLTRADLRSARLVKADFYQARLFKSALSEADCSGAYFRKTDLTQADFSGADLTKADLVDCNLVNGSLARATLVGADLSGATLHGVDMREATLGWTLLGLLDLSQIVGLDQIRHIGPSTLGFDTALRSHKALSREFLQACGITEGVVHNWESLFGHPMENLSCFIRYVPDDASFARTMFKRGQEKAVRCWLDEMPAQQADRKNRVAPTNYETDQKTVLCLSKASLTSWWVNDEIERVLSREAEIKASSGKDVRLLYPVNLDGYMFSGDWKHDREKQIAKLSKDFVGWRRNKEKFDEELAKLVQLMIDGKR